MKQKERLWEKGLKRLNKKLKRWCRNHPKDLFQRLFWGIYFTLICISVSVTGGFFVYYKWQTDESMSASVRKIANNNAKGIYNVFSQIELVMDILCSDSSGIHEKLMLYNGDSRSLVKAFYQAKELLNNYISIAFDSITTKYHVYLFLDSSYHMCGN